MDDFNLKNNERVGILSAGAICHNLTQLTLDSFSAIDHRLASGFSRVSELFNNSANMATVSYTFKKKLPYIVNVNIEKILLNYNSIYHTTCFDNIEWIKSWHEKYGYEPIFKNQLFIICKLCPIKMNLHQITINTFLFFDCNEFKKYAFSPLQFKNGQYYYEIVFQFEKQHCEKKCSQYFKRNLSENDSIMFFIERVWKPKIINTKLAGEDFIDYQYYNNNKTILIGSSGSSLTALLKYDSQTITSTRINDMFTIYGIEVARRCIIEELCSILPSSIKRCHLELVANSMTWSGSVASISRYTSRLTRNDVVKKIIFEEISRNLFTACKSGEKDAMVSNAARIVYAKKLKKPTKRLKNWK